LNLSENRIKSICGVAWILGGWRCQHGGKLWVREVEVMERDGMVMREEGRTGLLFLSNVDVGERNGKKVDKNSGGD
jgi:hypothetical protein